MTDLTTQLFALAESIADEAYGCGLEYLDSSDLDWYAGRVTVENLQDCAADLAAAAWEAC
jgi:hypothetical protein